MIFQAQGHMEVPEPGHQPRCSFHSYHLSLALVYIQSLYKQALIELALFLMPRTLYETRVGPVESSLIRYSCLVFCFIMSS